MQKAHLKPGFLLRPRRAAGLARGRAGLGRSGAAAAEFALVAIPTTLLMYGVMETSWQLATLPALDHATVRAVRFGSTGLASPGNLSDYPRCRSAAIPRFASDATGGLLRQDRMTVTITTYDSVDHAISNTRGTLGPGPGGKVVTYNLAYTQPWLVGGIVRLASGVDAMTFRSSLTIKNEPFDNEIC